MTDNGKQGQKWGVIYPGKGNSPPGVVLLLSVVFPGLGHMVLGQSIKGLVFMAVNIAATFVTCGVAWPVLIVISAVDGYCQAAKLKQGTPIGQWDLLWTGFDDDDDLQ